MKTIIHLELSDLDRNDLAKRIDRDQATKRLVTRKEVTELVHALIDDEIKNEVLDDQGPEKTIKSIAPLLYEERPSFAQFCNAKDADPDAFIPSRGDEDYLTQPKDAEVSAACSRILDDLALIENHAWNTIERNRK